MQKSVGQGSSVVRFSPRRVLAVSVGQGSSVVRFSPRRVLAVSVGLGSSVFRGAVANGARTGALRS